MPHSSHAGELAKAAFPALRRRTFRTLQTKEQHHHSVLVNRLFLLLAARVHVGTREGCPLHQLKTVSITDLVGKHRFIRVGPRFCPTQLLLSAPARNAELTTQTWGSSAQFLPPRARAHTITFLSPSTFSTLDTQHQQFLENWRFLPVCTPTETPFRTLPDLANPVTIGERHLSSNRAKHLHPFPLPID